MLFEIMAFVLLSHQPVQPATEGVASYYTTASSSTITASGERFRDDALTCAMLDGEFGDYYLVVAKNGASVVCRLNDRGPYIKGRVIDLSEAAMRALHPRAGLVQVKVYHLGTDPPDIVSPSPVSW
ncbi:MAG: septal ring lytic transglycosylase RlpA family lipoprotein [Candidatus Hydrogenedentes bacterium]|nr:septal ring lytic transglycosylase RlpA family lipoprotein [Candidatus Hydrogenedentota bacterium]